MGWDVRIRKHESDQYSSLERFVLPIITASHGRCYEHKTKSFIQASIRDRIADSQCVRKISKFLIMIGAFRSFYCFVRHRVDLRHPHRPRTDNYDCGTETSKESHHGSC
jgi:hypothetical protein